MLYAAAVFDYENNGSVFPIRVRATSQTGQTVDFDFTVQLSDADEDHLGSVMVNGIAERSGGKSVSQAIICLIPMVFPFWHSGWKRDGVSIGVSDSNYTLTASDVGASITAFVSYSDSTGTKEVSSLATDTVVDSSIPNIEFSPLGLLKVAERLPRRESSG